MHASELHSPLSRHTLAQTSRLLVAVLTVLALLVSGCGGGGSTSSTSTAPPTQTPPPVPPPPPAKIQITTGGEIFGVIGSPFSLTIQVSGGSGARTWSIVSGTLPGGISFDTTTGTFSGTFANDAGTPLSIQVSDSTGTSTASFIFILEPKLLITPVTPPHAHLGALYFLQFQSQGPIPNFNTWLISSGQLPPGLQFAPNQSQATLASISGTATQAGSFAFNVQVKDFSNAQTATLSVTIVVDTSLGISKASLRNGGQNQTYSDSFAAVNATTPLTWTISSGNLPQGLTLDASTGQVSGTPTNFGSATFSVSVRDQNSPPQTDTKPGSINIGQQLVLGQNQNFTAIIGRQFTSGIFVTGGTTPYTFTVVSGQLPPGVSINNPNGNFSGIPTQLGDFPSTIQVQDSSNPPYVLTGPIDIKVNPVPLIGQSLNLTAPVGLPFRSAITVSGGTRPYAFAPPTGNFPTGLSFNASTGAIDGIPTQLGTFFFNVVVTDSGPAQQTITVGTFITIRSSLGRNDSIATATGLGNSGISASISPYVTPAGSTTPSPDSDYFRLVAVGGATVHVETFAQRFNSSNLLDTVIELLDGSGSRLQNCGKPSYNAPCLNDDIDSTTNDSALDIQVPGAANTQTTFYLHVFDWRGDARPDMTYNLTASNVINPLRVELPLSSVAELTAPYANQIETSGGTGPVTWTLQSGSLPPGMNLASDGTVSGTPTATGPFTFTLLGADSANPPQTVHLTTTITVSDVLKITSSSILPDACVNQPYSFAIQFSGGVGAPTVVFNSVNWPLSLSGFNGPFVGTPSSTGIYTTTINAFDGVFIHVTQTLTLTVKTCP